MSFARPSLSTIVSRVQVDFVSRLQLVGAVLRRSMVYVLTRVIAGASHMLHGHLDWLYRQLFADTAEAAALVRQASLYGVTKTAPTFAQGDTLFTGVDGSIITAGSRLLRSDGAVYVVQTEHEIGEDTTGEMVIAVVSVLAGADYTLTVGTVLTFESPIAGVNSTATVTADGLIDGNDEEDTEAFRVRFLERLAEDEHGGTVADYVAWAKEVAGVTRAWVYRLALGPGTVLVRFVRDRDASIIPDVGEVANVQTHLDEVAPAHATVTAFAPALAPIDYTIAVTPDTTEVRAAVTAELTDLLLRVGAPGATVLISAQRTAIGNAVGLTDYVLTLPAADVTNTANDLPSVGTITWV